MDVKIHVIDPNGKATEIGKLVDEVVQNLFKGHHLLLSGEISEVAPEMTIPYYEAKIAKRNGIYPECVNDVLASLWAIQPGCVLSILLRAIAMEMDLNYPDHISQVEDVYVVDITNGQIREIKNPGIGYRNFAAFRCLDDAKGACMILKPLFKALYGGKQEDKERN